jgi:hemoglobin
MQISSGPTPWGSLPTPYDEMGGDAGVRGLAEAFYDVVEETSPVLRAMLPETTAESRIKLYEFLSGWSGGPPLYWERRGHPALRMRHAPFTIGCFEAEEWVRCLEEATRRLHFAPDLAGFLVGELGRAALQLQNVRPT